MLTLNSLLLHSPTPKELSHFYSLVLETAPSMDDGRYTGFQTGSFTLVIGPHGGVKGRTEHPERILLNFETTDVRGEFERIKKLGVKVIAEPYKMGDDPDFSIATFADPDGNYFQLMSPMKPLS